MRIRILEFIGCAVMVGITGQTAAAQSRPERQAVRFVGGFETDPRDHGRPVILIASALGVSPDVFREAFSHVHPARDGRPEPGQVQQNKQALLSALGRYGVTNDRLDEVSNYYRYMASRGETWRHVPATAYATVLGGVVQSITVTSAGAGYSSPPTVVVEGTGEINAEVSISFSRDFATNGSIRSIKVLPGAAKRSIPASVSLEEALRREAIPREVVGSLNLTKGQKRRMIEIAERFSERRELHERAMAELSEEQRAMVERPERRNPEWVRPRDRGANYEVYDRATRFSRKRHEARHRRKRQGSIRTHPTYHSAVSGRTPLTRPHLKTLEQLVQDLP